MRDISPYAAEGLLKTPEELKAILLYLVDEMTMERGILGETPKWWDLQYKKIVIQSYLSFARAELTTHPGEAE